MGTKKDRIAKDLKEQNRLKRGSKNIQNKYIRRESLNDWITTVVWSLI